MWVLSSLTPQPRDWGLALRAQVIGSQCKVRRISLAVTWELELHLQVLLSRLPVVVSLATQEPRIFPLEHPSESLVMLALVQPLHLLLYMSSAVQLLADRTITME